MNRKLFLFCGLFSFLICPILKAESLGPEFQVAKATKVHAASTEESTPSEMTVTSPLDSGVFLKSSTGQDFSSLGDLQDGLRAWNDLFTDAGGGGGTAKLSSSGLATDLELGVQMDKTSALSLDFGGVLGQTNSVNTIDTFGDVIGETVQPNLVNLSLNYSLSLASGKSTKTTLSLGAGWYHAIVNYSDGSVFEGGEETVNGTFTGDTLGGTLGINQEWSLGGGFGLQISLRGRFARFDKVTASSITFLGNGTLPPGPYTLAREVILNQHVLIPDTTAGVDASGGDESYVNVDYTGIDSLVSFYLYL